MSEIKITMALTPWTTPNYATISAPGAQNSTKEISVSIIDMEPETLSAMCDTWRAEVFRKAGKRDPRLS